MNWSHCIVCNSNCVESTHVCAFLNLSSTSFLSVIFADLGTLDPDPLHCRTTYHLPTFGAISPSFEPSVEHIDDGLLGQGTREPIGARKHITLNGLTVSTLAAGRMKNQPAHVGHGWRKMSLDTARSLPCGAQKASIS
jgi:hypothetical protein